MTYLHWILIVAHMLIVLAAVEHTLLYKRDPKGELGWIALCIIFPIGGPILYFLFGINRVRTRENRWAPIFRTALKGGAASADFRQEFQISADQIPNSLVRIALISDAVTHRPLVGGNPIDPLYNGEEAYPVMLAAIEKAEHTLYTSSYIFESNATGRRFMDALAGAARQKHPPVYTLGNT